MKKRGAIELSMGTIVIVVLSMSMLILGIILIRNIFGGTTNAVNNINREIIDEISSLFADPTKKMAVYPPSRRIDLKQGEKGYGFAFSVRNNGLTDQTFKYFVGVDENFNIQNKCGISKGEADSWIIVPQGSFTLARGKSLEEPELVLFNIPETAPPCTIPFDVKVNSERGFYDSRKFFVTIIPS